MKTTGITRRVDELGRIVIPKEIRKNFHLKSGELLEIFIDNNDIISLKKHTKMNKTEEFISDFIKILSKKINSLIYVTNLNEVVFSTNNDMVGNFISSDFSDLIQNGISNFNSSEIKLTDNLIINEPFLIYPISPNGDLEGIILFKFKGTITEDANTLIKFSIDLLEFYYENN